MREMQVKSPDKGIERPRETHVWLSDEEWQMLDYASDVLCRTKSDLIRDFISELYVEIIKDIKGGNEHGRSE